MLHLVRKNDLWNNPFLAATMFGDRRKQFCERLGWPLEVDGHGFETDEYDEMNPLYVILEDANGMHAGSMRLLPTTGRTMVNDHFSRVLGNNPVVDERVWECTRFCLAPKQGHRTALALLASGARIMKEVGLDNLVGIFDDRMIRLYRLSGIAPEIIGSHTYANGKVYGGYWSFDPDAYSRLLELSQLDPVMIELVLANASIPWLVQKAHA